MQVDDLRGVLVLWSSLQDCATIAIVAQLPWASRGLSKSGPGLVGPVRSRA